MDRYDRSEQQCALPVEPSKDGSVRGAHDVSVTSGVRRDDS